MPVSIPQNSAAPDIRISCTDLDLAIRFYRDTLQFRLDTIYPADAPCVASLSGYGLTLEIRGIRPPIADVDSGSSLFIVQTHCDKNWVQGRAGMQYCDLIPGRLGGKYIASRIRIRNGGIVPDYVHYHDIHFQVIYCLSGWVKVVYEDQGPAFRLHEGDCVLQPPLIRHRVLECSDNMEVLEISCPADHVTFVEHEMTLPTDSVTNDRRFGSQRFVRYAAAGANWTTSDFSGFAASDTGIAAATDDLVDVNIIRNAGTKQFDAMSHDRDLYFLYVLGGTVRIHTPTDQHTVLGKGDAAVIPAMTAVQLDQPTQDLQMLTLSSGG